MIDMALNKNIASNIAQFPSVRDPGTKQAFARPAWLLSDYSADVWSVSNGKSSPDQINYRVPVGPSQYLTDPEFSTFLSTIKLITFYARTMPGRAIAGTGETQRRLANHLMLIAKYAILEKCGSFADLTEFQIEKLKESLVWGIGHTLRYVERFETYVSNPQISLPTKNSRGTLTLSLEVLLEAMGIEMPSWRADSACAWVSTRYIQDNGFHVKSEYRHLLQKSMPELSESSADTLRKQYQALDLLYEWTGEDGVLTANDALGLSVNPFPSAASYKEALARGEAAGRTKTIPVPLAMHLLDRAVRWVLDYGAELLALRDRAQEQRTWILLNTTPDEHYTSKLMRKWLDAYQPENTGPGQPWPISGYRSNQSTDARPSLHVALHNHLPAACFVVLATFLGRRETELLMTRWIENDDPNRWGCFKEDDEGLWIEQYVEKTLRDWDYFPANEVVAKAIYLLRDWSASARAETSSDRLFEAHTLAGNVQSFVSKDLLQSFADFVEVPADETGQEWQFSDHQFRRMFAMLYLYRFELGDLQALSHHLRHFNLSMTLKYVTEVVGGAVFNEVSRRKTYEMFSSVAKGEKAAVGPMAHQIDKLTRRLKKHYHAKLQAVTEKQFDGFISRFLEKHEWKFTPKPFGGCFGETKHRQRYAKCRDDEYNAHPEAAEMSQCMQCPNFMTVADDYAPLLRNQVSNCQTISTDENRRPNIAAWAKSRGSELRRLLDQCEDALRAKSSAAGDDDANS